MYENWAKSLLKYVAFFFAIVVIGSIFSFIYNFVLDEFSTIVYFAVSFVMYVFGLYYLIFKSLKVLKIKNFMWSAIIIVVSLLLVVYIKWCIFFGFNSIKFIIGNESYFSFGYINVIKSTAVFAYDFAIYPQYFFETIISIADGWTYTTTPVAQTTVIGLWIAESVFIFLIPALLSILFQRSNTKSILTLHEKEVI